MSDRKINKTADNMIFSETGGDGADGNSKLIDDASNDLSSKPAAALMPMSPIAASATVINLILATGPFAYYIHLFNQ